MASQIATYQCPNCTAPLRFDSESGKLKCDFCASSFDTEQMESMTADAVQETTAAENPNQAWDTSDLNDDWGKDARKMKQYSCPTCGAELICHATTAATSCPYCGNNAIVQEQFHGALRPDYIIPFKVNKEEAIEKLKAHYKNRPFLPGRFTKENTIQEMKGVYVPFWLFDGKGLGDATYKATRVEYRYSSDTEYTDTYHYTLYREGAVYFNKIPVDASSKMDDAYMESLEPFYYEDIKPFAMSYLPGHFADIYDVNVEDCAARADERAKNTVADALREDASNGYSTCVPLKENIEIIRGKVRYALLPVWVLNTKWAGKQYRFAINGQTGKVVGDLPIDYFKVAIRFALIAGGISAIGSAVLSLFL